MEILESNHQINVVATYEMDFYEDGKIVFPMPCDNKLEIINIKDGKKNLNIRSAGCTMAVRKKFFDKVASFFVESWAHDDMMWKLSAIDGSCALYHKATIKHRLHSNNASRQSRRTIERRLQDSKDTILNYNQVISYIEANYPEEKDIAQLYEKYIEALKSRIVFLQGGNIGTLFSVFIKYKYLYKSPKQLLADIYLVIKEIKNKK